MTWLQRTSATATPAHGVDLMTDEELRDNFERTSENLMEVLNDPRFASEGSEMELEEIDF